MARIDVTHLSGIETGRRRYVGNMVAIRLAGALALGKDEIAQLGLLRQAAKGSLTISPEAQAEEIEIIGLLVNLVGGGMSPEMQQAIRSLVKETKVGHPGDAA